MKKKRNFPFKMNREEIKADTELMTAIWKAAETISVDKLKVLVDLTMNKVQEFVDGIKKRTD